MDFDPGQLPTRAPSAIYRTFLFWKWRKARRQIIKILMEESLQTAIFPHAHESREAQLAASKFWKLMQARPVPGEDLPEGLVGKGAAKIEDVVYGRFPRFGISAIGIKKRIEHWVRKTAMSEEGQDLFEILDADKLRVEDAKQLGALVAELFLQRLEVSRRDDLEKARLWLREEIRKNGVGALAIQGPRVETERARAFESSGAFAAGGAVFYLLDTLGFHDAATVAAGYGTAVIFALGSRYVVRRLPLLPRQVEFRLYVLEVICIFLQSVFRFPVTRSVPEALAVLQQALRFHVLEQSAITSSSAGTTRFKASEPDEIRKLVSLRLPDSGQMPEFAEALIDLRTNAGRLNDLAAAVTDPLVQAAVMRLEKAAATAQRPEDVYIAAIQVLEALSR